MSEVKAGCEQCGGTYELVIVDDGSDDGTYENINFYSGIIEKTTIIRNRVNLGITKSLKLAIEASTGEFIIWVPSDLECNASSDIPLLYNKHKEGYQVVLGERLGRKDGKLVASQLYNIVSRILFKTTSSDLNWIKGFTRSSCEVLVFRSDWHRYIAHICYINNFSIANVKTKWRKRTYGRSKFDWKRFLPSFFDLVSLYFLHKARNSPLRFFGYIGLACFIIASIILVALTILYFFYSTQFRPLVFLSLSLYIICTQLTLFGLIGELILDSAKRGYVER